MGIKESWDIIYNYMISNTKPGTFPDDVVRAIVIIGDAFVDLGELEKIGVIELQNNVPTKDLFENFKNSNLIIRKTHSDNRTTTYEIIRRKQI